MAKKPDIEKLREALHKDFNFLYVKEFTTDWKVQRLVRNAEIEIMPFYNTLEILRQAQLTK